MTRKQKMRIKRKQWKLIKTRVNSVCKKLDRQVVVEEDFKPDWIWDPGKLKWSDANGYQKGFN